MHFWPKTKIREGVVANYLYSSIYINIQILNVYENIPNYVKEVQILHYFVTYHLHNIALYPNGCTGLPLVLLHQQVDIFMGAEISF